jgi:hypothetical protein
MKTDVIKVAQMAIDITMDLIRLREELKADPFDSDARFTPVLVTKHEIAVVDSIFMRLGLLREKELSLFHSIMQEYDIEDPTRHNVYRTLERVTFDWESEHTMGRNLTYWMRSAAEELGAMIENYHF